VNDTVVTDSVKRFKWVGTRPIRPDGVPKVTGRAMYGADYKLPGMLYGKVLRSPHAHARIGGIETAAARAAPPRSAAMRSATASAALRSIFPAKKARTRLWNRFSFLSLGTMARIARNSRSFRG